MNEALLDPQAWERFFTPTNRYQEHVHFVLDDLDDQAQGPVALTGCAVEALSSTESITCESFRAFVRRRGVVFSQEHDVFVSPSYHRGITPAFQICTNFVSFVDGRASHLTAWSSRVGEKPVAFFNFLLVLLARIEQLDMLHIICQNGGRPVVPFSGPALEDFLTNANDNLGRLEFHNFAFDESHILAMANAPASLNLNLLFSGCKIGDSAAEAFLQYLQSNRGPTGLIKCEIETAVMVSALCGSKHLKRLWPRAINQDFRLLFEALRENTGLEELELLYCNITDDDWCALCTALATHPTLETLEHEYESAGNMMPELNAVAAMLWSNTVLREVTPLWGMHGERVYQDLVVPRLEMNRFFF